MRLLKALGLAAAFTVGFLLFGLFYTYIIVYHPVLTVGITLLLVIAVLTHLIYLDLAG